MALKLRLLVYGLSLTRYPDGADNPLPGSRDTRNHSVKGWQNKIKIKQEIDGTNLTRDKMKQIENYSESVS